MRKEKARELERMAALGDEEAQGRLQRQQSRTMSGPYCHLVGEWCVFVDDYSHYQGKVVSKFDVNGDFLLHVNPCYQVSQFWDSHGNPAPPKRRVEVSNGPVVLRVSRFKMVGRQLNDWPK